MEIEIRGEFREEMEKIEYHDIKRIFLERDEQEIEVSESENGIEIFQNPEEDLQTSEN